MKRALIAASFGTSDSEAEHSCIRPVENALRSAFPEYDVFRAYSSRMIQRKLISQGVFVENEQEIIDRLRHEGRDFIAVIPTCIIPGSEYDRISRSAAGLPVSRPLLDTDEDLLWMADLLASIAEEESHPLLLMGHGSDHSADALYASLRKLLPENVFLACLEGEYTLDRLLPQLSALPQRNLTLMPLMLAAGVHARKHLESSAPDSWKSILTGAGFSLRIRMQGLGSLPQVQQRFVFKASQVL